MILNNYLKKIIPNKILFFFRNLGILENQSRFKNKTHQEVFYEIYKKNIWNGKSSISGVGSEIEITYNLVFEIEVLIKNYQIKKFLDIPCGDFNWIKKIDFSKLDIEYFGGDIIDQIISNNNVLYKKDKISFGVIDLMVDNIPHGDLLLIRDCLVHFSYSDIFKVIKNLKNSRIEFLLITTFPNQKLNYDIITGEWRPLNFELPPFNFPPPIEIFQEKSVKTKNFSDKSLALWRLDNLEIE